MSAFLMYKRVALFVVFLSSSLSVVPSLPLLHRIQHTPRRSGSLMILVVGDWGRKGEFNQSEVADQMGKIAQLHNIDFVISTGDNFYKDGLTGVEDTAFNESYRNIYRSPSLNKPWYIGNRDYRTDVDAQLSPILKQKDWRWNCHRNYILTTEVADFFFVDTTPFVNKYQIKNYNWPWKKTGDTRDAYHAKLLEELLTALQKSSARWKIVVGHHTMKSAGENGETEEIVKQLLPILEDENVEFYFHGHDHCLQHVVRVDQSINKLQFVTSGGGSKAWVGKFNELDENYVSKHYYDGQGFMITHINKARVFNQFYDIHGKVIYKWSTFA